MSALNDLTQFFNPQPTPGAPGLVPPTVLTPPAPVKPVTVVRTKPANTGSMTPNSPSAGTPSKASGSTTSNAPAAAGAPSSKSKLGNYLSDVAGGLTSIPANANAISAFAYGFAGSIKAGDSRRLADKNAAIAAEDRADAKTQQAFNNQIALKNAQAGQLVDDNGGITPSGRLAAAKISDPQINDLGLKSKSAAGIASAQQSAKDAGYTKADGTGDVNGYIQAIQQQAQDEVTQAYGGKVAGADAAGTPSAALPTKPTAPPAGQDASSGAWQALGNAWKWITTTGTFDGNHPKLGPIGQAAVDAGQAAGGSAPPTVEAAPAAAKPGAYTGSGKTQADPIGPFNEDADGKAAVVKNVPPGGWFVAVGPDGTRTVYQRNK